jgi:hypothetical protein
MVYTEQTSTYRLKATNNQRKNDKIQHQIRDKITTHPNELRSTLLEEEEPRRCKTTDLTAGFS